jgi:hypothetical protein
VDKPETSESSDSMTSETYQKVEFIGTYCEENERKLQTLKPTEPVRIL